MQAWLLIPFDRVNIRRDASGGLHQIARYQSLRKTLQSQLLVDPLNALRMEEFNEQ